MAEVCGDVLDNWEDQVDSGVLDERLKKISVSCADTEERPQPVLMQEYTGRTEYKPQVRILKREPNTHSHAAPGNTARNVAKANKPMKTLEQREAEYAEARMRIFGAAESSELELEPNSTGSVSSVNCAVPSSDKQYRVNKEEGKPGNSTIRQPLGPDDTRGFHAKR
ncbi:hypothetical protein ACOMHN_016503 [Nucella lapillus]